MSVRQTITTSGEGVARSTLFVDQISFFTEHGKGCLVATSDGAHHIFHNVSYDEMVGLTGERPTVYRLPPCNQEMA